jgi:NAD(P)-dependent dehydrogenase (short-subunit alcohol dehydrogenase family)
MKAPGRFPLGAEKSHHHTFPMNPHGVTLVTGSSRGLGRGVALALAKLGTSVAVHYGFNREAAEETAALCQSAAASPDQRFIPVCGDIGQAAGRRRLYDETIQAFGRIDALVNNAGIAPRVRADITEATEDVFDEVIDVNLKGPYFLTQLVASHWLAHPGESLLPDGYKLIFVSSLSATVPSLNRGDYCVSKAGLAMVTQLWANRLAADGISTIELRPGIMATDMTAGVKEKYDTLIAGGLVPQMRWGTPDDLGRAVSSILAGHFPFSTGDVINIDGGFHLRKL